MEFYHWVMISERMFRIYRSHCAKYCKKMHLNQTALELIVFLGNNPEYNTAKEICEYRGLKKSMVSITIDQLVEKGYMIRETDQRDRRIQHLFLTDKSAPTVKMGKEAQSEIFGSLTTEISREELTSAEDVLYKIERRIAEIEKVEGLV